MIIDTFYLLYKFDTKDAQKALKELEKKIEEFEKKGKKASEAERNELKKLIEEYRVLKKEIEDSASGYDKAYEAVQNTIGNVTKSILGFIGAQQLLNKVIDVSKENSSLEIQARLLGEGVKNLKAYDNIVTALGGNIGEFRNYVQGVFEELSAQGLKTPPVAELVRKLREGIKETGNDPFLQQQYFSRMNITGQGIKNLVLLSDEEFAKYINQQNAINNSLDESSKQSRKLQESTSNLNSSFQSLLTAGLKDLLPTLTEITDYFSHFIELLEKIPKIATFSMAALGLVSLRALKALSGIGIIGSILGMMGGAGGIIGAGALGGLAIGDFLMRGKDSYVSGMWEETKKIFNKLKEKVGDKQTIEQKQNKNQLKTGENVPEESYRFASMPLEESSLSPDFIEEISTRLDKKMMQKHLEEAQKHLDVANSSNIGAIGNMNNAKNIDVKVGDIHVNTRATDPTLISNSISTELVKQCRTAMSNLDDCRQK